MTENQGTPLAPQGKQAGSGAGGAGGDEPTVFFWRLAGEVGAVPSPREG